MNIPPNHRFHHQLLNRCTRPGSTDNLKLTLTITTLYRRHSYSDCYLLAQLCTGQGSNRHG